MKKNNNLSGCGIGYGFRNPCRNLLRKAAPLLFAFGVPMLGNAQTTWTSNYLLKTFNNSSEYINSLVYDNGACVGVGTTSPTHRLDVNGNVHAAGTLLASPAAGTAGLILNEASAAASHSVDVASSWGLILQNGALKFDHSNASGSMNVMKLQSSLTGGVLQVNGMVKATRMCLSQGAAAGYLLASSANGIACWKDPALITGWAISGNNVMKTSGKVGIGTTDMAGQCNIQTSGQPGLVVRVTPSATNWGYGILARVESPDVAAFAIENNGDPSLMIWGDGRIHATAVKVKVPVFPDYVFRHDYPLMSLPELQTYIRDNAHLPGLPTAATVTADGLDLGEINLKLVEKVEELSLYVIQLNEQNNELRARLDAAGIPNNPTK